MCAYLDTVNLSLCHLRGDVGRHFVSGVTDEEAGRVEAVAIIDNALRRDLLSLSLEPYRDSEFVLFSNGKPRTKKGYLEIIMYFFNNS